MTRQPKPKKKSMKPLNVLDFRALIIYEVREELRLEDYRNIIDLMPARIKEVLEREGGQTRY